MAITLSRNFSINNDEVTTLVKVVCLPIVPQTFGSYACHQEQFCEIGNVMRQLPKTQHSLPFQYASSGLAARADSNASSIQSDCRWTSPGHHIICQHSKSTELKGLGVYMNFMGTLAQHATTMWIKFDGMAQQLQQSSLSPASLQLFYNTFFLPSVGYALPVTSTTRVELCCMNSLSLSQMLSR